MIVTYKKDDRIRLSGSDCHKQIVEALVLLNW